VRLLKCYLCFLGLTSLAVGDVIFSDFDPTNVTYQGGWGVYGRATASSPVRSTRWRCFHAWLPSVSYEGNNYLTHLSLVQFGRRDRLASDFVSVSNPLGLDGVGSIAKVIPVQTRLCCEKTRLAKGLPYAELRPVRSELIPIGYLGERGKIRRARGQFSDLLSRKLLHGINRGADYPKFIGSLPRETATPHFPFMDIKLKTVAV